MDMGRAPEGKHKTVFVGTCLGVFQGGGCRAAALAGAFDAAVEGGVYFASVAGTSAGSIVAALIGAGATPEFLLKAVEELDFKALLVAPDKLQGERDWTDMVSRATAMIPIPRVRRIARLFAHRGQYSSVGIERWLEGRLSELLPHAQAPVAFADLPVTTHVIATDLQRGGPKVWSSGSTPNESVAFAVRASCSIPFFFQPVIQGQNRFVDGGLLSNLPSFVFSGEEIDRPRAARVLAFRLTSEPVRPVKWSLREIATSLGNAVVEGATELQGRLQADVSEVKIPTPGVHATDFDTISPAKVAALVEAGRRETRSFLKAELTGASGGRRSLVHCDNDDDVFAALVSVADRANEVLIATPSADWVWKIFPTVLLWRLKNVRVAVILRPIEAHLDRRAQGYELSRRTTLLGLGVCVSEGQLPFQGYVFNANDPNSCSAILFTSIATSNGLAKATLYDGPEHWELVQLLRDRASHAATGVAAHPGLPRLVRTDPEGICRLLREGVSQYRAASVRIAFEPVRVGDLMLVVRYIREWKYRQADRFVRTLQDAGLALFSPVAVALTDGRTSIIGPPVFEESAGKYAVIEGHTRCLHARISQSEQIEAVVVRGVTDALPAKPVGIRYGAIAAQRRPPRDWQYGSLRRIEDALRPVKV